MSKSSVSKHEPSRDAQCRWLRVATALHDIHRLYRLESILGNEIPSENLCIIFRVPAVIFGGVNDLISSVLADDDFPECILVKSANRDLLPMPITVQKLSF